MPKLNDAPRVWNKRDPNVPRDAVYVGRPTKWGNPYSYLSGMRAVKVATRAEAIELYRQRIVYDPDLLAEAKRELRGKHLVCWCAPLPCHADVLLEIANAPR